MNELTYEKLSDGIYIVRHPTDYAAAIQEYRYDAAAHNYPLYGEPRSYPSLVVLMVQNSEKQYYIQAHPLPFDSMLDRMIKHREKHGTAS